MSARPPRLSRHALLVAGALAAFACQGPPGNLTFVPTIPTVDGFQNGDPNNPDNIGPVVSAMLEIHCGTLDCHGTSVRNLRIYGIDGIRSGTGLVPGGDDTTDVEHQLTYSSLIAMQPEVLASVVSQHGAHPERWIVVTKGRGSEQHKGGVRITPGSDADHCLISWLSGTVGRDICGRAADVPIPGGPAF